MFCLRSSQVLLVASNKNKKISTVLPPPQSFFKQFINPFVYLLSTSHIVLLSFTTLNVSLTSSSVLRPIFSFVKKRGLGVRGYKNWERGAWGGWGGFPSGKEGEGRRPISEIILVALALRANLETKTTF